MTNVFVFPLYSACIGVAAVLIPILAVIYFDNKRTFIKGACTSLLDQKDVMTLLRDKFDYDVFDAELEDLLDKKLDDLVLVFKKQIPMASTFLVGNIVVRLKESAKKEFLKMLPEMKDRLLIRLEKDVKAELLCFDNISNSDIM